MSNITWVNSCSRLLIVYPSTRLWDLRQETTVLLSRPTARCCRQFPIRLAYRVRDDPGLERIRQFALDHYVAPARAEGAPEITIRAGDVHREMSLANAMSAVCSAIGSNKLTRLAHVTPINRTGPANRANVYFQFSLVVWPVTTANSISANRPATDFHASPSGRADNSTSGDALVLSLA